MSQVFRNLQIILISIFLIKSLRLYFIISKFCLLAKFWNGQIIKIVLNIKKGLCYNFLITFFILMTHEVKPSVPIQEVDKKAIKRKLARNLIQQIIQLYSTIIQVFLFVNIENLAWDRIIVVGVYLSRIVQYSKEKGRKLDH